MMIEYFYHFDYLRDVGLTPTAKPKVSKDPKAEVDVNDWLSSLPKKTKSKKSSLANDTVSLFGSPTESRVYIIEHAKVFAMAIKYQIDGTTADDVHQLRQIVSDTLHEHLDDLKDKKEIEVVVRGIPGLAYDLMKRSREPVSQTVSCVQGHGVKDAVTKCHQCREVYFPCSGCPYTRGMA